MQSLPLLDVLEVPEDESEIRLSNDNLFDVEQPGLNPFGPGIDCREGRLNATEAFLNATEAFLNATEAFTELPDIGAQFV